MGLIPIRTVCKVTCMSELERAILSIFESDNSRRATAAHLIDELDRRPVDFSMDEFDAAITALRERGEIRVKNPRAPMYDQVILRKG